MNTKSALLTVVLALLFSFVLTERAVAAIDRFDGAGELDPCPTPNFCKQSMAMKTLPLQDNGLHNSYNALHGPSEPTINIYEISPENDSTSPPTPAQYKTVAPGDYQGAAGFSR